MLLLGVDELIIFYFKSFLQFFEPCTNLGRLHKNKQELHKEYS